MSDFSEGFRSIEAAVANLSGENELLQEELNSVKAMLARDEVGWHALGSGYSENTGMSLSTLKDISRQAREMAVGNPLIDRALALRYSYVWSKGVSIPGVQDEQGVRRGRKSDLENFFRNPVNQRYVFGDEAHEAMENSAGTDGAYLLIGDDSTKELRSFPVTEIAAIHVNPEFTGEIWAVLREWNPDPSGTAVRRRWYYSDTFTGKRQGTIVDELGKSVPVATGSTLLDVWFNRQTGWALGIPDATAGIPWARIYSELIHNGRIMTEALARFVAQVKAKSQKGAKSVGVKMGGGGVGQTAVTGEGNELSIFQSAGKTYDFNGVRPVAALVATALEVSIIHLLSDPGAAGSSYGSASNLDLPTKRAMVSRQNTWRSFLERVIKWGTNTSVNVSFPSLDDPDPYREAQITGLAWNSGLVHEDEARPRFLSVANMASKHSAPPENVLLPNNSDSWERNDIDPSADPATTTSSPDQGQSNGGGGTDSTLANDLTEMKMQTILDRLEQLDEKISRRE